MSLGLNPLLNNHRNIRNGFVLLGLGFYPISCCAKLISLIRYSLFDSVDVQIAYPASHSLYTHVIHLSYRMKKESTVVLDIYLHDTGKP